LDEELRERARRLAGDRQARAEEAAAAERRRIAGELHDLVAHGVSGMVVQAGAARRLVQKGDPRAAEAILAVEDGGREALTELRRLLGVLRREDADLALAPQPSLARVGALVEQLRTAGTDVTLEVRGDQDVTLSPGVDVAGYRIVEEALRGVPGPARVLVEYCPGHIDLHVEGGAAEPAGLAERVRLFGGELVTARRGGALRARLPLSGAPA
jgi:signal transduction histidine kinase